jgi:hypothetical protein
LVVTWREREASGSCGFSSTQSRYAGKFFLALSSSKYFKILSICFVVKPYCSEEIGSGSSKNSKGSSSSVEDNSTLYHLCAAVVHHGRGIDMGAFLRVCREIYCWDHFFILDWAGHYTAFCLEPQGTHSHQDTWVLYDDIKVEVVSEQDVVASQVNTFF